MNDELKTTMQDQPESTLEEFSVIELEERLEFVAWCNECGKN